MKKSRGITLISLVITIIILLILSGISIAMLTGNSGILSKVSQAKEKTIEAQLKEEIEIAIIDIQMEEIKKGNSTTLEVLIKNKLENRLEDITTELNNNEITGEYKGYDYTIDDKLNVIIGAKASGISLKYTLNTTGYTNQDIILTIIATSINGDIIIDEPDNLTKNEDGTYTITRNGNYEFIVTDSNGNRKTKTIKIDNIDKLEPKEFTPTITDVTEDGFTINAKTEDQKADEENTSTGIERYEYYINEIKNEQVGELCILKGLDSTKDYSIYVKAFDNVGNVFVSECIEPFYYMWDKEEWGTTEKLTITGKEIEAGGTVSYPTYSNYEINSVSGKVQWIDLLPGSYTLSTAPVGTYFKLPGNQFYYITREAGGKRYARLGSITNDGQGWLKKGEVKSFWEFMYIDKEENNRN